MLEMMRALLALQEQFPDLEFTVTDGGFRVDSDQRIRPEGTTYGIRIEASLDPEQVEFLQAARQMFAQ